MLTCGEALIEARQVSVTVSLPNRSSPLVVVNQANLTVRPGVSYSVVGPSGSGKTSLLSVLGLLNTAYSGSLMVDGIDASTLNDRKLSRLRARDIGFVFQRYSLVPHMTALGNVLVSCAYARVGRSLALNRAKQVLAEVGLAEKLHERPVQLSGGEQQRVAIARALVNHPRLILADEPTGALDTDTGISVMRSLIDRVREASIALVVVTHDETLAEACTQHYTMERGHLRPAVLPELNVPPYAEVSTVPGG